MPRRVAVAALLAVLGGASLTGCSGLNGFSNKGVATDGVVSTVDAADREAPVAFEGTTLDGKPLSSSDFRGKVVVINVWGSWCAECRVEMPHLLEAEKKTRGTDVQFLGIDTRETSKANAEAFVRNYDVPWPSLDDAGGRSLLALRGVVPPNATPSTIVLDKKGRVAARILGVIPSTITLTELIEDAAK